MKKRGLTDKHKKIIVGVVGATIIGVPLAYILYKYFIPPEEPCVSNADCFSGYECIKGVCQKESIIPPDCVSDTDCLSGFSCIGGKCVYVEPEFVTISGTVMELREGYIYAPISGASIKATNKDTGETYNTKSIMGGVYVLENMTPGIYNMITSKNGYCSYTAHYLEWTYPGNWDYGYMNNAINKMSLKMFTIGQKGVNWVSDTEADLGHNEDSIYVKGKCTIEYWDRKCTGSCASGSDWDWGTSVVVGCEDGVSLKAWDDCYLWSCIYHRPYIKIISCEG